MLESYIPLVEGQKIADYRQVITTIRKKGWLAKGNDGQGLQGLDLNLADPVHHFLLPTNLFYE